MRFGDKKNYSTLIKSSMLLVIITAPILLIFSRIISYTNNGITIQKYPTEDVIFNQKKASSKEIVEMLNEMRTTQVMDYTWRLHEENNCKIILENDDENKYIINLFNKQFKIKLDKQIGKYYLVSRYVDKNIHSKTKHLRLTETKFYYEAAFEQGYLSELSSRCAQEKHTEFKPTT